MKKTQFTKKIISIVLIVALIDMQFPFILALMNRDNIAEELGRVIVVEIIGVILVYCLKSFFETREEKNNELKEKALRIGEVEVDNEEEA